MIENVGSKIHLAVRVYFGHFLGMQKTSLCQYGHKS